LLSRFLPEGLHPFPGGTGEGSEDQVRSRFLEDISIPAAKRGECLPGKFGEKLLGALWKREKGAGRKI
jgi:hypothetical protein